MSCGKRVVPKGTIDANLRFWGVCAVMIAYSQSRQGGIDAPSVPAAPIYARVAFKEGRENTTRTTLLV